MCPSHCLSYSVCVHPLCVPLRVCITLYISHSARFPLSLFHSLYVLRVCPTPFAPLHSSLSICPTSCVSLRVFHSLYVLLHVYHSISPISYVSICVLYSLYVLLHVSCSICPTSCVLLRVFHCLYALPHVSRSICHTSIRVSNSVCSTPCMFYSMCPTPRISHSSYFPLSVPYFFQVRIPLPISLSMYPIQRVSLLIIGSSPSVFHFVCVPLLMYSTLCLLFHPFYAPFFEYSTGSSSGEVVGRRRNALPMPVSRASLRQSVHNKFLCSPPSLHPPLIQILLYPRRSNQLQ